MIKLKCYQQTDSLTYKIEAEDVCQDFNKNNELFDFNNYPKVSKYHINAVVIDKMKYEICDVPIEDFVGLKSKTYSFITEENYESRF